MQNIKHVTFCRRTYNAVRILWALSGEKMPSDIQKLSRFRSPHIYAKYHLSFCSPLIHSTSWVWRKTASSCDSIWVWECEAALYHSCLPTFGVTRLSQPGWQSKAAIIYRPMTWCSSYCGLADDPFFIRTTAKHTAWVREHRACSDAVKELS